MTLPGTAFKTGLLLLLLMISAAWSWHSSAITGGIGILGIGGVIAGFVVAIVIFFKPKWSPALAPVYAICEGLFLGGISEMYNKQFSGIVLQAIMLTFGVMAVMLFLYQARILQATPKFAMGVIAATGGIFLVYLASMVMGFFGHPMSMINGHGMFGIGFSVFVVIIAALNLILDFGMIEHGVKAGAPRYMEWYASFALMVTLVWLYLEILRLLAKTQQR